MSGFQVMAVLSSHKRGIFAVFGGQIWNSIFRASLMECFPPSPGTISFRISRKISAMRDERFSNYGCFKLPNWGIFVVFLGKN
jgi:hypothetical protein